MASILVLGSGGREHALCWKLAQSTHVTKIWTAPGNAGTAGTAGTLALAENIALDIGDPAQVVQTAQRLAVDLVVIGPEAPLVAGVADALQQAGVACFGPSAAAAMLEASKSFTKQVCASAGIPTADSRMCHTEAEARAILDDWGVPIVFKADGLAAGKGVMVCHALNEAEAAINALFTEQRFGAAAQQVLIEQCLFGAEASLFVLCDGQTAYPLGLARDHKRIGAQDTGPNTGGMGCYTPIGDDAALIQQAMDTMITPTLRYMHAQGTPFCGVLFAGLMLTEAGLKLIEYNVRFGDPECQALLYRLQSDLYPLLLAAAKGQLAACAPPQWHDQAVVNVVLSAPGYPGEYPRDLPLPEPLQADDCMMFHAGTRRDEAGILRSAGGRVLNVCARGADLAAARRRAYAAVVEYAWTEGYYRDDIGPGS